MRPGQQHMLAQELSQGRRAEPAAATPALHLCETTARPWRRLCAAAHIEVVVCSCKALQSLLHIAQLGELLVLPRPAKGDDKSALLCKAGVTCWPATLFVPKVTMCSLCPAGHRGHLSYVGVPHCLSKIDDGTSSALHPDSKAQLCIWWRLSIAGSCLWSSRAVHTLPGGKQPMFLLVSSSGPQ